MNLYEMLHRDHERVRELFNQLERTGESEEGHREHLFSALHRELDIHSQAEEKFFYSQLRGEQETREIILESFDEHKDVRKLLGELEAMDKGSAEWTAKLRTLRENVEHHVAEEENELFPRAKKVLQEDEAAGIAEDIESFKEEHTELEAY
jgi:iron-sulfur cluster repair protein YtfE (RIC family)